MNSYISKVAGRRIAVFVLLLILWFVPPPEGLSVQAMHLFAIFISAIFAVIINAMPILVSSLAALVIAVLTGTMDTKIAYSGFGSDFIWLIVAAFIIGRGVINSGLGARIAYRMILMCGRTTLGLGYALVMADALIAVAFPSNTARSGVLYPIVLSVAKGSGSNPDEATRKKLGAYLMMNSMAGLTISSMLWMTAMAANPVGTKIAADMGIGIDISFGSWFIASSVPATIALFVLPRMLYKFFPPEIIDTPHAQKEAADKLKEIGPLSRDEWVTGITFLGMVFLWAMGPYLDVDRTIVAFLGLTIMMLAGIITMDDITQSGDALSTLIWFAILYTMSTQLNALGFMGYLGDLLSGVVGGYNWPTVYVSLMVIYVLIHYLFVSQTAQLLALFGVFLGVAVQAQVPPALMALMLLFATNFFAAITPQGSSANVVFAGSGYLTQGEIYRNGALITLTNFLIFMIAGTPWIMLVT
jgi:divalent anion:Na+ symporter, DASS family